jgi:hypothetical protein
MAFGARLMGRAGATLAPRRSGPVARTFPLLVDRSVRASPEARRKELAMTPWSHSPLRFFVRSMVLVALALSAFAAGPAHAAVPSPATSLCPPIAAVAPNGSCCFDVIVRDAAGLPVAGSTVVVDFGTCPVTFCPAQPHTGNAVVGTTDASGRVTFCICATVTLPCNVVISADGIVLCSVPVANNCDPTPNHRSAWGTLKVLYR